MARFAEAGADSAAAGTDAAYVAALKAAVERWISAGSPPGAGSDVIPRHGKGGGFITPDVGRGRDGGNARRI